jgi:hypothetical protein
MKNKLYLLLLPLITFLFTFAAVAADGQPIMDMDVGQLLSGLAEFVMSFFREDVGSLPWYAKLSSGLTLLLGALKSSKLSGLWDWLGDSKRWAAAVLAIALVPLGLLMKGDAVTLGSVIHAFGAGIAAAALADLFDLVKAIPGLNKYVLMFIELVQGLLGGKTQPSSESSPAPSQPAN